MECSGVRLGIRGTQLLESAFKPKETQRIEDVVTEVEEQYTEDKEVEEVVEVVEEYDDV